MRCVSTISNRFGTAQTPCAIPFCLVSLVSGLTISQHQTYISQDMPPKPYYYIII